MIVASAASLVPAIIGVLSKIDDEDGAPSVNQSPPRAPKNTNNRPMVVHVRRRRREAWREGRRRIWAPSAAEYGFTAANWSKGRTKFVREEPCSNRRKGRGNHEIFDTRLRKPEESPRFPLIQAEGLGTELADGRTVGF